MKTILAIIACIAFVGISAVHAQTSTPVVDQRQANQRARIRDGAATGELTAGETAKARSDQRKIRRTERRAKADGEVTPSESARLQRKQNKASRSLRRNKNDAQTRP